jgi:dephospho-CoA kinase
MGLYISIIGIDGSGKSTVTPALADLVAAELGVTAAAIGDDLRCKTPEEDLFLPGFVPDGEILAARLGRLLRKGAKAATAYRRLYPPLKLAQLVMQERTARWVDTNYRPDVIFCDGNLLLSSAGRAINYLDSKAGPATFTTPIEALYDYVMEGKPLPPKMVRSIPGLKWMRWLRWFDERLNLGIMELPDALVLLDIAPETALARLMARDKELDRHENIYDMTQAQTMYRRVVEFFRHRQGERNTAVIDVTELSVGQTLQQILDFVRRLPLRHPSFLPPTRGGGERERLGTTSEELSNVSSVAKKVLTYQYLARYTLPNLHRGSAHELTFPLSQLGQFFFREGYSAGVMKAIYLQDSQRYDPLDRIFLDYPLHRAVYHRLQILKRAVEREFWYRLERLPIGGTVKVMTAPSGYAFDLLQPLERIARSGRERVRPIHILASDLDPDGRIERELVQRAQKAGIGPSTGLRTGPSTGLPSAAPSASLRAGLGTGSAPFGFAQGRQDKLRTGFEFVRGDLTSTEMQERFKRSGPYDMVVFVGLSCWISKPHLVHHLKFVHRHLLAPGGVLFTDCFTPQAFALSGKCVGYKANYYSPREFTSILTYCGFDPADITWESGPEGINHVCVARIRPHQKIAFTPNLSALRPSFKQASVNRNITTHRLYQRWSVLQQW